MLKYLLTLNKNLPHKLKIRRWSFSTVQEESKKTNIFEHIKDSILNNPLSQNGKGEKVIPEINYAELAKKVQHLSLENKEIANQLMSIHKAISTAQEESYCDPNVEKLLHSSIVFSIPKEFLQFLNDILLILTLRF